MDKYYQPKQTRYKLPRDKYKEAMIIVRAYYKYEKKEFEQMKENLSKIPEEGRRHYEEVKSRVEAVESAVGCLEPQYHKPILAKICYGSYPQFMGEATYYRKVSKLLYDVAKNKGLI